MKKKFHRQSKEEAGKKIYAKIGFFFCTPTGLVFFSFALFGLEDYSRVCGLRCCYAQLKHDKGKAKKKISNRHILLVQLRAFHGNHNLE